MTISNAKQGSSGNMPEKITTGAALKSAFTDRQVLAMLILGLASGLPYVAVGGTLNAWLTTVDVKLSTIGLLSWASLAYAFKFMWAAGLQSRKTPFGFKTGPRRFWMYVCIGLVTAGLFVLSSSEPPNGLGRIALTSVLIAFFSSCFDIVLAAWRIEVARDSRHLDILSAVEQFGYRFASLLGGFVALLIADQVGWKLTFLCGSVLMAATAIGVFLAEPTRAPAAPLIGDRSVSDELGAALSTRQRSWATVLVLAGWGIGFFMIAQFMYGALSEPENYDARKFIRYQGPWVICTTIIWLGIVAATLNVMDRRQKQNVDISRGSPTPAGVLNPTGTLNIVLNILYKVILEPMMELTGRLKWASFLVLGVILSYRFTDLIWGSFAYPFYLGTNFGALGHTLTEVGFASKLMGVIATILGIGLGGLAMLRFGRMPVFFFGAVLAAVTNLLFADLALGAPVTDAVLGFLRLDDFFGLFGLDQRMARLTTVIAAENIAVGLASAASVAYLSSIVNKKYAAVQYALLVSLVMLLGTLGRPTIGAIIETKGFATTFFICAALGGVAVILALCEWIRTARQDRLN